MPKYRKKPVIVEAVQWMKMGDHDRVRSLHEYDPFPPRCLRCKDRRNKHGVVSGIDGIDAQYVCPSDWIVTTEDCPAELFSDNYFREEYEKVEE